MKFRIAVGLLVVFAMDAASPRARLRAAENNEPRKLSKKEEKQRLKQLRKELAGPFKRWLDQDVTYIITGEERKAFCSSPPMKSARISSSNSGCAATPLPTPSRTSTRKSTTAA